MGDLWSVANLRVNAKQAACAGKRVLILRPKGQQSVLRDRLERLGVVTLSMPVLEIVAPSSYAALDAGLADLDRFDWTILTSANAVDAVAARLPDGTRFARLAVIGTATLARVREVGLPEPTLAPILVPPRAVAESLADELEPLIRRLVNTQGHARVLLPRAEQARDALPERLRTAGASISIAPAYRNCTPSGSIPLLREIFENRELWPDAIPFTSSSSVKHLLELLATSGQVLPPEILRVSIGPVTSLTLRENGLEPHVEAAQASVESLVEAVISAMSVPRDEAH